MSTKRPTKTVEEQSGRPLRVYVLTDAEREEWDRLEAHLPVGLRMVSCADCAMRSRDFPTCAATQRTYVPTHLKHRCATFRPIVRHMPSTNPPARGKSRGPTQEAGHEGQEEGRRQARLLGASPP